MTKFQNLLQNHWANFSAIQECAKKKGLILFHVEIIAKICWQHLKIFLSRNNGAISTKRGTKHPCVRFQCLGHLSLSSDLLLWAGVHRPLTSSSRTTGPILTKFGMWELYPKGGNFGVKSVKFMYFLKNLLLSSGTWFRQAKCIVMVTKEGSTNFFFISLPPGRYSCVRTWPCASFI